MSEEQLIDRIAKCIGNQQAAWDEYKEQNSKQLNEPISHLRCIAKTANNSFGLVASTMQLLIRQNLSMAQTLEMLASQNERIASQNALILSHLRSIDEKTPSR
jgi:hypothetical protein